jgi:hypothetical protein
VKLELTRVDSAVLCDTTMALLTATDESGQDAMDGTREREERREFD